MFEGLPSSGIIPDEQAQVLLDSLPPFTEGTDCNRNIRLNPTHEDL